MDSGTKYHIDSKLGKSFIKPLILCLSDILYTDFV